MSTVMTRRMFAQSSVVSLAAVAVTASGMTGCSTTWIDVALKDLPVIVSIANTLVSVIGEATGNAVLSAAASAAITEAAQIFSTDIGVLQDAINAYQSSASASTLTKAIAALDAVQADATKIIAALPINVPALASVLTAGIGTVVSLLAAIESLLPTTTTPAVAAVLGSVKRSVTIPVASRVAVTGVTLPDAQTLKSQFNSVLSVYGYGGHQL